MAARQKRPPEQIYDALQKLIPEILETKEYLDKCVRCGLALEKECEECAEQLMVAEGIKREFFPDRP